MHAVVAAQRPPPRYVSTTCQLIGLGDQVRPPEIVDALEELAGRSW